MIGEYIDPPWNTHPENVNALIVSVEAVIAWEQMHGQNIPHNWGIVLTHRAILDLCHKLKFLDERYDS